MSCIPGFFFASKQDRLKTRIQTQKKRQTPHAKAGTAYTTKNATPETKPKTKTRHRAEKPGMAVEGEFHAFGGGAGPLSVGHHVIFFFRHSVFFKSLSPLTR